MTVSKATHLAFTVENWKVVYSPTKGWAIWGPDGTLRGRYRDAEVLASHLAMAYDWIERLQAQLRRRSILAED